MKRNIKYSMIGFLLLFIIFLGMFSTYSFANGNYNIALTKGTDIYIVSQYDDVAWKTTVNSSTTPSNWFEGDANQTGAKSKNTIKGWNYVTWEMYDVFVSLFLSVLYEDEELIPLLTILNIEGYNETTINNNYSNSYNLWVGLRAVWNFTIGSFEEDPTISNDPLILFQNPQNIDEILSNYNNLSAELNSLPAIQFSSYSFPILEADEFLWLFIFNGLTLATPFNSYLEELITALNCKNATVNNNILTIKRTGETDYTTEIYFGTEGTISSFVVKDEGNNIIYQIITTNSDWIFFTTLIVLIISIGALTTYLIIRKIKIGKRRTK
ncbi:MAG: hypothetical protein ACFFEY_13115 [Candidatus Thorarchaeota archaeon]